MKKIMALLLLTAVLCTACGHEQTVETPEDIAPQMPEAVREVFSYEVETNSYNDSVSAEDGELLARYSFQLPALRVLHSDGTLVEQADTEGEEAALAKAQAFNDHFAQWMAAEEFADLAEEARDQYEYAQEEDLDWFGGYELDLNTSVYQTEQMVSVFGLYYSFSGGAHPNTWGLGWNYDLTSGSFFTPEELAADSATFQQAMVEELLRQGEEIAAQNELEMDGMFWSDYADIMENWSSYAVFFDADGMTVYFSAYELASYAAGPQVFTMSYDWLRPHLSQHGLELLGLA